MRKFLYALLLALALAIQPAMSQDLPFEYVALKEGLDAARDAEKMAIVYLYSEESGGLSAYDAIWDHELVDYHTNDLGVVVAIDGDSEEGTEFVRHLKKRLKTEASAPGVYFFSDTGRLLGSVKGQLEGPEAPGRILLALGAASYARSADQGYTRHYRPRYGRWYY